MLQVAVEKQYVREIARENRREPGPHGRALAAIDVVPAHFSAGARRKRPRRIRRSIVDHNDVSDVRTNSPNDVRDRASLVVRGDEGTNAHLIAV